MLKLIKKNKKILKKNFIKNLEIFIYKIFLTDLNIIVFLDREKILKHYKYFNKLATLTQFRKTCYLTNRARGNINLFHLSRYKVKILAWGGLLVGLKRLSW